MEFKYRDRIYTVVESHSTDYTSFYKTSFIAVTKTTYGVDVLNYYCNSWKEDSNYTGSDVNVDEMKLTHNELNAISAFIQKSDQQAG